MGTDKKPKEYCLLDMQLPSGRDLRLLIYHAHWPNFLRLMTGEIPFEDITGQSFDREDHDQIDALVTWKCADFVFDSLTNLQWIQTTSAGIDQLLHLVRGRPEILVSTAKGIAPEPIASYVLLMMLAFQWDLPGILERQRQQLWKLCPIRLISGATCAVIGLGNVGRMVAQRAKELGMTVIGSKRRSEPVEQVDRLFTPEQLPGMLAMADFVVLTVPLTEETRRMFGAAEFEAMKPTAFLIQVSRGGVLDEEALLHALQDGQIAGAAVDVFEEEPLPADHPLWDAPHLIITAHQAAEREDYIEAVAGILLRNLKAYPDLGLMQGIVNPERGY
jgi:phosphoglycerate dehydrogenase-like enzyme